MNVTKKSKRMGYFICMGRDFVLFDHVKSYDVCRIVQIYKVQA